MITADASHAVVHGPLLLACLVALAAGVVSFCSPCVLPLVPGFVGYVSGQAGTRSRAMTLLGTTLFIVGFSAVFLTLGLVAGSLGWWLREWSSLVSRILGVVVIGMGLIFLGVIPGMSDRAVVSRWRPQAGLVGAPLLGAVFGLGWQPCLGPVLAAISALGMVGPTANPTRAFILNLCFCAGLGIPFLIAAWGLDRGMRGISWLREHRVVIGRIGGGLLVAIGVLLVTGLWVKLIDVVRVPLAEVGVWL